VDEEIARQDIQRSRDQINRNTLLKDAMRERDIPKLAEKWFEVIQEYRAKDPSIAELGLKAISGYVAWMDISLVVNDQVMTALYQMLGEEPLRIASCECLAEVVAKGMKPLDKLSLIQMLNIADTLTQLDLVRKFIFLHFSWPHVGLLTQRVLPFLYSPIQILVNMLQNLSTFWDVSCVKYMQRMICLQMQRPLLML
jgi:hypothetical protein